jgi:Ran GTPase-activating protein (RanGAP) involved in mRNA processing and transport
MPIHELLQRINANDPALTTIEFMDTDISNEMEQLCAELCKNKTVTELRLKNVVLSESGIKAIGQVVTTNTTLTCLDLSDCALDKLVLHLITPLKNNKTLTSLKLAGNKINTPIVKDINEMLQSNTTLATLDLGSNMIDNVGLQYLSMMLKTNKTLRSLNLHHNSVTGGIVFLADALKTNRTLRFLDLSKNLIVNNDIQHLGNKLMDNFGLYTLNLAHNRIGDLGIESLCKGLVNNVMLTSLDLKYNNFTDTGAQHINVLLQTNDTLSSLELTSKKLTKEGVKTVCNALASNYSLVNFAINANEKLQRYPNPNMEYIARNKRIKSCLKPLGDLIDNISLIVAIDPAKLIKKVEKIVPADTLSKLNQKHYLAGFRQILEALGHIKNANAYAQMSGENCEQLRLESEIAALQSLLSSNFSHNGLLRKIADLILVHTIFNGLSKQLVAKAESAFWQLGFFLFEKQWSNPELQVLAYNVLFNLHNPGKKYTMEEKSKFEATTALLTSRQFSAMLAAARQCCEAKLIAIQQEIHYIKSLQKSTTAKQEFLLALESRLPECEASEKEFKKELFFLRNSIYSFPKALVYSPCFIAEFEKSSLQKTQFIILGKYCLLHPLAENFIIKHTEPGSLPTEEEVNKLAIIKTMNTGQTSLRKKIVDALASFNPLDTKSNTNTIVVIDAHEPSTPLKLGKRKIPEQSSEQSPEKPRKLPKIKFSLGTNFLQFKNQAHSDTEEDKEDMQEDSPSKSMNPQ